MMVILLRGTMKKLRANLRAWSLLTVVLGILSATTLIAIDERIINLRIEGPDETIFHTNVAVSESCEITDGAGATSTISGYKALCALEQARTQGLLTSYVVDNQPFGYWLDAINGIEGEDDFSKTWIVRLNNARTQVGIADQEVQEDDQLLLTYGPRPSEPLDVVANTQSVHVGKSVTLSALSYDDDLGSYVTSTDPTTFYIDDVTTSTENGSVSFIPQTEGVLSLQVEQDGKTRSQKRTITVLPELDPISVTLRIEGPDNTITHETVSLPETCMVTDENDLVHTIEGYAAICALQQALDNGQITKLVVKDFGDPLGLFVDNIDGLQTTDDFSSFWVIRHNFASSPVGVSSLTLEPGDTLFLHYSDGDDRPLRIYTSTTTVTIGHSFTVLRAQEWIDDFNNPKVSAFVNYVSTTRFVGYDASGQQIDDILAPFGTTTFTPTASGTYTWYATAPGKIKSEPLTITVNDPPAPRRTFLRIEGPSSTLALAAINTAHTCAVTDSEGTIVLFEGHKAICTLQRALDIGRIDSFKLDPPGFGYWLDAINGIEGEDDFSKTWIVRLNDATTQVGIADQEVQEDDQLLLTYGPWPMSPLDISFSTSTFASGTPLLLQTLFYDDDVGQYSPLQTTSTFTLDTTEYVSPTGTLYLTLTEQMLNKDVYVSAQDMTRSGIYRLIPEQEEAEPDPPDNGDDNNGGGGSSPPPSEGSPEGVSTAQIQSAIDKLITYISSQQDESGKIIDAGTSDWALMSFAAAGIDPGTVSTGTGKSLTQFVKEYQFDDTELNLCAAHARHVMALLSAGVQKSDPLIHTSTAYLTSSTCYANGLFGLPGINDDVFALFALLDADATSSQSQIITDITNTIVSDQQESGASTWAGFESPDITGAVLNVLSYAKQKGVSVAQGVLDSAKTYLKQTQNDDGGWGPDGTSDALNTSWAMMGVAALGESQINWYKNDLNPWHALTSLLHEDGYYEASWDPGTVDWFGTKHAIPALSSKSWPITPVAQEQQTDDSGSSSGGSGSSSSGSTNQGSTSSNPSSNETGQPPPIEQSTSEEPETPDDLATSETPSNDIDSLINELDDATVENSTATVETPEPIAENSADLSTPATGTDEETPSVQDLFSGGSEEELEIAPEELLDELDTLTQGEILAPNSGSTPIQKTARGVFGTSVALAGSLSTLLAWRLLQTLI